MADEICHCGKKGWRSQGEANRVRRVMQARPDQKGKVRLTVYICKRTNSGLYHVGH